MRPRADVVKSSAPHKPVVTFTIGDSIDENCSSRSVLVDTQSLCSVVYRRIDRAAENRLVECPFAGRRTTNDCALSGAFKLSQLERETRIVV